MSGSLYTSSVFGRYVPILSVLSLYSMRTYVRHCEQIGYVRSHLFLRIRQGSQARGGFMAEKFGGEKDMFALLLRLARRKETHRTFQSRIFI